MRILYVSQYYPPEIGAGAFRADSIVRGLKSIGHELTVITEVPNYPTGVISGEYRNRLWVKSTVDGIDIHRVWVKVAPRMNIIKRLCFYQSFNITAILRGMILMKKHDVVYATSPPLFVGLVGLMLSRFFRLPFVFEVRDLWPEIAIELGVIKSSLSIRLSTWLEKYLYRKSTIIVTVTEGFKKKIIEKGISEKKIHIVLNFSKVASKIERKDIDRELIEIYKNKFVVLYAGLLGLFQGVDVIVRAAQLLQLEKSLIFHIIGSGVEANNLVNMAQNMNLKNIVWTSPQPDDVIHYLLANAGCAIVPLRNLPGLQVTIPSKLFDYMGCGCPIVLSAAGEVRRILGLANAGIAVDPENPGQLAKAVQRLYNDPELRKMYSRNARRAVIELFSSEHAVRKIDRLLGLLCHH